MLELMLYRASDYHQTLSLLMLWRLYSEPTVSLRFQAVICDSCVLSALEGFPLEAKGHVQSGRTGSLSVPCIPAPVRPSLGLPHLQTPPPCLSLPMSPFP